MTPDPLKQFNDIWAREGSALVTESSTYQTARAMFLVGFIHGQNFVSEEPPAPGGELRESIGLISKS